MASSLPCFLLLLCIFLTWSPAVHAACPEITSVSPLKASRGAKITLTGCGLDQTTAVTLAPFDPTVLDALDGKALTVDSATATEVIVTADAAAENCGDVVAFDVANAIIATYTSAGSPFCNVASSKWGCLHALWLLCTA